MDLSASWMLASTLVGTIGLGLFVYGKKEMRVPQLAVGLALMVYPYFIASPAWMFAIGGALLGGLFVSTRAGL